MAEEKCDDCSICLSELKKKQKIVKLSCNHYFHLECISKVNSNACPLCRCEIISDADICKQQHYSHFTVSNFKKNGTCRICFKKKTFKDCLENLN